MELEFDLTVFNKEFDAHKRGKQCIREIKGIQANKHPHINKKLSEFNQKKLLEYAAWMIRKIKREELSFSSFEKNISENWKMLLFFGEKKATEITEKGLEQWCKQQGTPKCQEYYLSQHCQYRK